MIRGTCGKNLTWTLDDYGMLTISGTGEMENYFFDPCTKAPWKNYCLSIKKVIISDGVKSIGSWAFYSCKSLVTIKIPSSVRTLGDGAFCWCESLTKIELPDGVTSIGTSTFSGCVGLTSIRIPDGVKEIGFSVFSLCRNLREIILPNNLMTIGDYAFAKCKNLTELILPNSLTIISNEAFRECTTLVRCAIPDSVTFIGNAAFDWCESLIEMKIPKGITKISSATFRGCINLTEIIIPDNVTSIGSVAFYGCESLTTIVILGSVTTIAENGLSGAFYKCDKIQRIYYKACISFLAEVKETLSELAPLVPCYKIIAGEGVKILSEPAFVDGDSKFYSSKVKLEDIFGMITDVEISEGIFGNFTLTPDGNDTFIIDVTFGSGILSWKVKGDTLIVGNVYEIENFSSELPWGNFIDIIKKIVIVNGVEKIVTHAFADCPNVEEIVLPASVTSIGDCAFSISFCGNNAVNDGKNVFWCLEEGILVIKKNPAVKDIDADFSMGDVSWEAARKNIRGFKFESGVVLNKTFFDWFIQRDKTMKLSAD